MVRLIFENLNNSRAVIVKHNQALGTLYVSSCSCPSRFIYLQVSLIPKINNLWCQDVTFSLQVFSSCMLIYFSQMYFLSKKEWETWQYSVIEFFQLRPTCHSAFRHACAWLMDGFVTNKTRINSFAPFPPSETRVKHNSVTIVGLGMH